MVRPLVVKVTCGADDPERCNQGFTVAATALAAGAQVSLWLTGEAAWFGVPGRAEAFSLDLAAPLADLLAAVLADGPVTVCAQCAQRRRRRHLCRGGPRRRGAGPRLLTRPTRWSRSSPWRASRDPVRAQRACCG